MERKEYSAGAVKLSFWFSEFRKVVEIRADGKTYDEIKEMSQEQNIFAAPTPARAKQICSTVTMRVKSLDPSIYQIFVSSDLTTQKLINLVAVMASDSLFFDFVYEVVREKIIIGSNELTDSDISIFFKNKQQQSDKVAEWTDATLIRLSRCYKTMLFEAGMIDKSKGVRKIYRAILDPAFEQWLDAYDMKVYGKALAGVR